MQIKLLTKKYKGIFISVCKSGIYVYFHFPTVTHRIFYSGKKSGHDSYSTVNFNRMINLELEH